MNRNQQVRMVHQKPAWMTMERSPDSRRPQHITEVWPSSSFESRPNSTMALDLFVSGM